MDSRTTTTLDTESLPVSPSLRSSLDLDHHFQYRPVVGRRVVYLSALAVAIGIVTGALARLLDALINFITNISFLGRISTAPASPVDHHLGLLVIGLPVIGGLVVGIMARYGSKAIRGHGIPEAMEQVLVNQSRIKPIITLLKPISTAISIGTGGPFGTEGPIIATGGALGSVVGQMLRISPHERKILLTAGAAAGMAAIFGSPLGAVLLAIELLLFEYSPRSIIPVALASLTGAAMHRALFGTEAVFAVVAFAEPGSWALVTYVAMGIVIGVAAGLVSKSIYVLEDWFEKLPIHWMWWPALGGLAVGVIGYFAPETMGVGYNNIRHLLAGDLALKTVVALCVLKFLSWSISLSSGTAGGTMAPLLTIGGACGALLGMLAEQIAPGTGVTVAAAALVGMAAMFAGASRALLTSIVFTLETTMQPHALAPLLAGCTASYLISYFMMRGSIMTEKIERRGVVTPKAYEPDVLGKITVRQVTGRPAHLLSESNTLKEVREWIKHTAAETRDLTFAIVSDANELIGLVDRADIFSKQFPDDTPIVDVVRRDPPFVYNDSTLNIAVDLMDRYNTDALPVLAGEDDRRVVGVLLHRDVFKAYRMRRDESEVAEPHIRLRHRSLEIIVRGKKLLRRWK